MVEPTEQIPTQDIDAVRFTDNTAPSRKHPSLRASRYHFRIPAIFVVYLHPSSKVGSQLKQNIHGLQHF